MKHRIHEGMWQAPPPRQGMWQALHSHWRLSIFGTIIYHAVRRNITIGPKLLGTIISSGNISPNPPRFTSGL